MENLIKTHDLILETLTRSGSVSILDIERIGSLFNRSPGAMRTAVHRMEQSGMLERIGGDPVRIKLSNGGINRLRPVIEKIELLHRIPEGALSWDGIWHCVAFEVPEQMRSKRDAFRRDLYNLGFRKLITGFWIFPRNLREKVEKFSNELALTRSIVYVETDKITFQGQRAPIPLARRLWKINEIENNYIQPNRRFARFLKSLLSQRNPPGEDETLFEALLFLCQWSQAIESDPFLPIQFLGPGWEGFRSHELLHQFRELVRRREIPDRFGIFTSFKMV